MAPIKFEENIREKLEERELQPSEGAWGKLESRLGTTPQQKKPTYFWMAIAASLVGILFIGSWLFFGNGPKENELVNEDRIENPKDFNPLKEKENEIRLPVNDLEEEQVAVTQEETPKSQEGAVQEEVIEDKEAVAITNTFKENTIQTKESVNSVVAEHKEETVFQERSIEENTAVAVESQEEEQFIQQKVDQVIEEVKKIQEKNSTVSAAEIDALLAKAQRDIAAKRILNSNQQKVDAQALLMDVEVELERSFRDRVFDALGEGFTKVRTAVAERNN
ncbi:MAG: hypothetical protein KTR22_09310 [Flavobacteriaceae bacterium]|nr:hypothetical protein [Flavobacteriaceae bacterium]